MSAYLKLTCADRSDSMVTADVVGPRTYGRRILSWLYPYTTERERRDAAVCMYQQRESLRDEPGLTDFKESACGDPNVQLPTVGDFS